jgi:hypothetical protein
MMVSAGLWPQAIAGNFNAARASAAIAALRIFLFFIVDASELD